MTNVRLRYELGDMGNQISWHVVLAIKQDQLDDFQALTAKWWSSREPNRAF